MASIVLILMSATHHQFSTYSQPQIGVIALESNPSIEVTLQNVNSIQFKILFIFLSSLGPISHILFVYSEGTLQALYFYYPI